MLIHDYPQHGNVSRLELTRGANNRLVEVQHTYCPTWSGMAYVAFVFDVFSRRILGWRAAHKSIDDLTPVAAEELYYRYRASLPEVG